MALKKDKLNIIDTWKMADQQLTRDPLFSDEDLDS